MKPNDTVFFSDTASYFNEVAAEYGAWYEAPSAGGYALSLRRQLVLDLLDRSGGKALDVGCGPGVMAQGSLNAGYEFWGVDTSPGMIKACRRRFEGIGGVHFSCGDITSLNFPDGFFDSVICMGVIDFVQEYEQAIKETIRVLRKDGTLLISFPNLHGPYTAWSKYVFFPTVALLRPVYYRLMQRPEPPSLPLFRNKLYTRRAATSLIAEQGVEVTESVYFYYNPFLSPLDEMFPARALKVTRRLERLRSSKLKWLGSGFILRARKRS